MKRAVFLDRDGTIIELVHHLTDPSDVRVIPGAGAAIARLKASGWIPVIVTNQSVIGRGMLDFAGLDRVHEEMNRQLSADAGDVDAIYFCPTAPQQRDQRVIEDPMRKPGAGMLEAAALDHGLSVSSSWMIGDSLSDMGAGRNAGCRTILVETGYGDRVHDADDLIDHRSKTLVDAVDHILTKGQNE